jgi:hypothetical protein
VKNSVCFLTSFLVTSAMLCGQAVSTSQIKGVVQDASGLAVPGAELKATQTDTGLVRTAVSGTDGGYVLPDLPVGPYQLEVGKQGFARYIQTGIVLQVASNPTIDVALKVGTVSEQVQVQANASMVETQSTGVGQVIDSQRVQDLPLVGRQVTDLIILAGGASQGGDFNLNTSRNYPEAAISVAGGLASGLTYVLDGAMHNDVYNGLGLPLPFPDALQEFKVETSALPAQYGMHSAAAVNAVTRSGSNSFHGDAFEYIRNGDLNARDFFAISRDTLKRNQFGGTFGGPIRKDKLFFFGAYQGTTTRSDPPSTLGVVPTAAELTGDFSTFASGVCQRAPVQLKDPFSGALLPNNQIPKSELSPQALAIAAKLPTSNDPCGKVTYGILNNSNDRQGVGKVDYQLSDKHSIFARYLAANLVAPVPYTVGHNLLSTGQANSSGADDLDQAFALGDTYLISPNIVSTFRATLDRTGVARVGAQFFGPQDVGINIFSYLPKYTSITVGTPPGNLAIGNFTSTDARYLTTTLQFGEDIGMVRGAHQMSFGANVAHWNSNTYAEVLGMGMITFSGQATGLPLSDFLTGRVAGLTQAPPNVLFVRQWYLGLYAQDSWKVRQNLTFSYGMRWEPYFPMRFPNGYIYHFDQNAFNQNVHSTVFARAPAGIFYPGDPGFPDKTGMNKQWKDFMPRVGMAFDPQGNGRMSIRASYGIFYDLIPAQYHLNTETAPPFFVRTGLIFPAGGLADPYLNIPGGNPFPVSLSANAPFPTFGTFNTSNYNTHTTYSEQWNLSVQRQFGASWLASVSYLGTQMVHLFTEKELNPGVYIPGNCTVSGVTGPCSTTANTNQRRQLYLQDPVNGQAYGYLDQWDDGGTGTYNGLLLSVQKRLSKGTTMSANYTWSHCISDIVNSVPNGGAGGSGVYAYPNNRAADRGSCWNSAVDHRHIANLTLVAETPRFEDRWVRMVATGWRVSMAVTMMSGSYFTVYTGVDNALTGENGTTQRANLLSSNVYGTKDPNNYLVKAAFGSPITGTYGNLGNAAIEGPGLLQVNSSLSRAFRIKERQAVELRVDASNLLNRVNLSLPNNTLTSPTFGQVTSDISPTLNQAGDPRILQFSLKYIF